MKFKIHRVKNPPNPLGKGASKISPLEKGASKISPLEKGASKISPLVKGASKISPLEKGASKISPFLRGNKRGMNFEVMNYAVKDKVYTYTLLAPWLITFAVFWLYPLLYALVLSFSDYKTLTGEISFIGLDNYSRMFNDSLFWKALRNTVIFTFGTVPVTTFLALVLAAMLNSKMTRFKDYFKTTYFLPSVTSLVVLSLIFVNLYSKDGYINTMLKMLNMPYPELGWLLEPSTALFSIMAMDVWIATGYYMILCLAAMQTIPEDLYDSAKLSGANARQMFFRITIPMLKPTLLFILIINTIKSFQIFVEIYVMTKGGPLNETTTLVYMIFVNAFDKSDSIGYAAAIAYFLFILLVILSLIQIKILKIKDL